jgi:hypothetical protein
MLQDEVSKYSLNLTKINLTNASKPKVYNIKSNIDPSLVGISNSMGRITKINNNRSKTGRVSGSNNSTPIIQIETVKVPFPVLVDKFNIVGKSDNASFNNTVFYGIGKMQVLLYPFDNIFTFTIANGDADKPDFLNMSGYGDVKLIFKDDSKLYEFPLYTDSGSVNLALGQLAFKVTQNKFADIKRLYETGVNVFYITSDIQSVKSVVYSGLYKIYDNLANVADLNQAATNANPNIIKDPKLPQETATVTRRPVTRESSPVSKPGMNSGSGGFSDIRLKENIKNIGKSDLGINIYEWNYINDNIKYKGVIAQELLGTKFEKSLSIKEGFYWVDYTNLDVKFEKIN